MDDFELDARTVVGHAHLKVSDLALDTWRSEGGGPPGPGSTGLFHVAFRLPTRRELAGLLARMRDTGVPIDGASDHLVSEAIYLRDPDGNGLEFYVDRDPSEWAWEDGQVEMATLPLDVESLEAELD